MERNIKAVIYGQAFVLVFHSRKDKKIRAKHGSLEATI